MSISSLDLPPNSGGEGSDVDQMGGVSDNAGGASWTCRKVEGIIAIWDEEYKGELHDFSKQ